MEPMDITFGMPRVSRKVSGKMPAPNNFFLNLSKEHFVLSTIYGTLYIFLMMGGRASTSWASTESRQTAFQLPKVLSSPAGVRKVNCWKTLQAYTTKDFSRPTWQAIREACIWIKMNQKKLGKLPNVGKQSSSMFSLLNVLQEINNI